MINAQYPQIIIAVILLYIQKYNRKWFSLDIIIFILMFLFTARIQSDDSAFTNLLLRHFLASHNPRLSSIIHTCSFFIISNCKSYSLSGYLML